MTVGERIKALRESKNMTMARLGEAVGVTSQAVWNWESGANRGPSRDVLPRLAFTLGVTVDELLRDDEQAPVVTKIIAQPTERPLRNCSAGTPEVC